MNKDKELFERKVYRNLKLTIVIFVVWGIIITNILGWW